MKVLHLTNMVYPNKGIIEQIKSEYKAASLLGLNWDIKSFGVFEDDHSIFFKWKGKFFKWIGNYPGIIFFKRAYYRWVLNKLKEKKYDILLLRYQPYDFFQYRFIKKNKKKIRIYLVLHSLCLEEIVCDVGFRSKLKLGLEKFIGPLSIKEAHGVIGVTEEIAIKEQRRAGIGNRNFLIYPNGILVQDEKNYSSDDRTLNTPELLFVAASFAPWHGLDLLFSELQNSNQIFVLHLVGEIQKEFLDYIKCDKRIIYHGKLTPLEIKSLAARSWLGLSSFAHFRLKMNQASTLKVREYLSNGLPVYASYEESFPPDFPFYKNGPCNINLVIEYAKDMRKYSNEEVRKTSNELIDKKILLSKLYYDLNLSFQTE